MRVSLSFFLVCLSIFSIGLGRSRCSSSETLPSCKHNSQPNPSKRKERRMPAGATALDFREMLRKEREAARQPKETAENRRYLSSTNQRPRLHLERDHRITPSDDVYYVANFVTAEEGERLLRAVEEEDDETKERTAIHGGRRDWKDLHKRRLQIHGGVPSSSGMVEEKLPLFLREVCEALVEAGVFPDDRPPNHVLLNEYTDGQGIGPHKDGPLYDPRVAILSLGEKATLEFWKIFEDAEADCAASARAADADGELLKEAHQGRLKDPTNQGAKGEGKNNNAKGRRSLVSVECEHCSLVVFEGRAYRDLYHGIAATSSPRGDDYDSEKIKGMDSHGKKKKRLSFTVRRVVRVVGADTVLEHPEARSEMERRRRAFERSVAETTGIGKGGVAGNLPPPGL